MKSKKKQVSTPNRNSQNKDVILAEISQLEAVKRQLTSFIHDFYPLVNDKETDCPLYSQLRLSAHEIRIKIELRLIKLKNQLYRHEDNPRS